MTLATCGRTSPTPFAFYDPDSSSLRTSQGTLILDSTSSSVTLPRWGSMRSGALYARPMSGPATSAPASSSLLPTPVVNDMGEGKDPTQWTQSMQERHGNGNGHGRSLSIEVRSLPTPTVGDAKSAANATATRHVDPPTGVHAGTTLTDWARLLPTPKTSDANGGGPHGNGGPDLRTTVKRLPGATMAPPSSDTLESSDALPPHPSTSEDV